jgi:hypothetical protein
LGAGDEGTHERVKTHLVELIDPKIREQTTDDGVLAEFASVVDACAVQVKSRPPMADRDLDLSAERHLRFRIGADDWVL